MATLAEQLARQTRESDLCEVIDGNRVRCLACGLRCPIPAGFFGVCKVRANRAGKLFAPFGYVNTLECEPIEKKPFYHVRPGTTAASFGMLGCSYHCGYCQNWITSQAIRDFRSSLRFRPTTPRQIVDYALARGANTLISTYNEPLITAEWAAEIFRAAHSAGLLTGFVSNGNATPEVLAYLRPHLDLFKVDLKCFTESGYRSLGGRLAPVLDSIRRIHDLGYWLEVVTVIVPGFNDSPKELTALTRFLSSISPWIPWHMNAFHPDYKMTDTAATPPATLERAAEIGRAAGLRFVYAGNLSGAAEQATTTKCPGCRTVLVRRRGYRIIENRLAESGRCFSCDTAIPGVWAARSRPPAPDDRLVHRRCG